MVDISPIIGGAFGECSKSTDTLLQYCAINAVASNAGIQLTPETDTSSLYSARNLLLHDFPLVVGCSVLRANIDLKFKRLPYIQSTIQNANQTVSFNKKSTKQFFSSDSHRWFQNIGDNGVYDTFIAT